MTIVENESELLDPITRPSRTISGWTALRLLSRRVHFLAGMAIAPLLAVLCLSGIAYAFSPQINDLVYGDTLSVGAPGGSARPVAEQVAAAQRARPGAALESVIVSDSPDATTRVVFPAGGHEHHGGGFNAESTTVYVNPYTTEIAGQETTVSGRPPVQVWLREFHGNLKLGEPGRLYAEFVASWLPVVVIGGLVLWLGKRRGKRLTPDARGETGRARTRGWHGAIGLWISVGLLAVSVTGLTWSVHAGERVDDLVAALDARSPSLSAPAVVAPAGATPIDLDRVITVAREGGLSGTLTVTPPAARTKPFKVTESSAGLPVQKDSVAVDPYTGAITGRVGWDDYPLLAKLTTLGIQGHSGELFGLANQIVMALIAAGALVLLVLGYRMWWKRRPAAGGLPASPHVAWSRVPRPVIAGIVVATAALAWAMPVLGVTLAVFLLIDFAVATARGRRSGMIEV
ncbi:putative iron-regulated membrane protein [Herbihabitans rhizosphaerae]|uniref:Putative iron-regulated membrane protein n=1 Tax=Herbihabitans rhizosphaerae TaxID=1872711 RepID=A0A4Q7KJN7_9PSEU|nr:PepSY domain-containing protein [Herbihabitans rhizosphaerae]RZS36404.1 putative iron-regulated membrane protein [Herbihabitans rhizosphaerae]